MSDDTVIEAFIKAKAKAKGSEIRSGSAPKS